MPYLILGGLVVGLSLGLLGSGGSILTVPVLVYLAGHAEKTAIAEALAIVGIIAAVGCLPYARAGLVHWRSVVFFGGPGMIGTWLGAVVSRFVPGSLQLVMFGVVILVASWRMFRGRIPDLPADTTSRSALKIIPEGLLLGILTGFVGVGGGFLIVPALVLMGKLPMRQAIGTSLVVIALNAITGFLKHLDILSGLGLGVDWPTIGVFAVVGMAGSLAGHRIGGSLNQRQLRTGFASVLVVMGLLILVHEAPQVWRHQTAHAQLLPDPSLPRGNR